MQLYIVLIFRINQFVYQKLSVHKGAALVIVYVNNATKLQCKGSNSAKVVFPRDLDIAKSMFGILETEE